MTHKLLERQLKILGLDPGSLPKSLEAWQNFLSRIDKVYADSDQDRYLLERSLDMSSKEMQKRWQSVKLLKEQWRSLGECTPDLIVMTDLDGKINFANRSKSSLPKESMIGRELKLLYSEEHQEKISKLIAKALDKKDQTSTEFSERTNSQETWLSLRIRPVIKGEAMIGLVVVETDVTEVRRVAQEVAARRRAEESVETKARFLANMSHEIRTPLNGILGMANLLADQITGEENIHKLEVIQNCGETLLALINDILDFSKLESGKIVLENIPFELFSCVKDIVDLLGPKASEKGLLLHYKIENSVPNWIFGDTTRVRQILLNLVGNAIKFTEKGEVLITVSSRILENRMHELTVSVKDTGLGISQEAKQRLFQSFSQVDAATTRKFGGTGLGLSICKGLSEAMGGAIGVNSELGQGSDFYFTMLAKEAPTQTYRHKNLADNLGPEMSETYPLRILVAEDNRVNQLVVVGFLKRLGYSADIAGNGIEVIHSLERQRYDLILMDCHMPEMDGFQATAEIIRRWPDSRPKIIAATASTLEDDRKKCQEVGMDDMLPKPITVNGLTAILQKYAAQPLKALEHATHPTPSFTARALNRGALMEGFNGVETVLLSTLPSYLESYPTLIKALKTLVDSGNFEAIKKITIALRASSAGLHMDRIVCLCEELEACCEKRSLVCVKARILELEILQKQLFYEIDQILQELRQAG